MEPGLDDQKNNASKYKLASGLISALNSLKEKQIDLKLGKSES